MRKKFKTSVQLIWILHHPPSWFPCIVQTRSTPPLRRVCQDRRRRSESVCWLHWGRSARLGAPSAAWSRPRVTEDLPPHLPWCWPRESPWEFSWGSWCLAVEWINRMIQYYGLNVIVTFRIFPKWKNWKLFLKKWMIKQFNKKRTQHKKRNIKKRPYFHLHLLNKKFSSESVWRSGWNSGAGI